MLITYDHKGRDHHAQAGATRAAGGTVEGSLEALPYHVTESLPGRGEPEEGGDWTATGRVGILTNHIKCNYNHCIS